MSRLRCSVYIATSLDGYIARPDGGLDWLEPVQQTGEDYGYGAFWQSVDTLIIGRKTYETALGFDTWPYSGKRCVVLTHGAPTPRHGEELYSGELGALVERLLAQGSRRVYVDGGSVITQFLAGGLIDDVTLSFVPVLLGGGIRLTQEIGHDVRLALTRTRAFDSGLVQVEYRVVS